MKRTLLPAVLIPAFVLMLVAPSIALAQCGGGYTGFGGPAIISVGVFNPFGPAYETTAHEDFDAFPHENDVNLFENPSRLGSLLGSFFAPIAFAQCGGHQAGPSALLVATPGMIAQGNSSTLSWGSSNVTSCTGTGFSTGGAVEGSVEVSPSDTTNYLVSCTGPGGSANDSDTVTVLPPGAFTASCSVSPSSINVGQSATWSASASGGTGSYTYDWSGSDSLSGSSSSVLKTYTSEGTKTASVLVTSGSQSQSISCSNSLQVGTHTQCSDGEDNDGSGNADYPGDSSCSSPSDTSEDGNAVSASLTANPLSVVEGGSSTLSWDSDGASSCTGTGFSTGGAVEGSASTGPLSAAANYQVTCTGPDGSATDFARVTVGVANADISASPDRVRKGNTSTITWHSANAASCSVTGPGLNSILLNGSEEVPIFKQSTFTINCEGATDSTLVNVVVNFQEF